MGNDEKASGAGEDGVAKVEPSDNDLTARTGGTTLASRTSSAASVTGPPNPPGELGAATTTTATTAATAETVRADVEPGRYFVGDESANGNTNWQTQQFVCSLLSNAMSASPGGKSGGFGSHQPYSQDLTSRINPSPEPPRAGSGGIHAGGLPDTYAFLQDLRGGTATNPYATTPNLHHRQGQGRHPDEQTESDPVSWCSECQKKILTYLQTNLPARTRDGHPALQICSGCKSKFRSLLASDLSNPNTTSFDVTWSEGSPNETTTPNSSQQQQAATARGRQVAAYQIRNNGNNFNDGLIFGAIAFSATSTQQHCVLCRVHPEIMDGHDHTFPMTEFSRFGTSTLPSVLMDAADNSEVASVASSSNFKTMTSKIQIEPSSGQSSHEFLSVTNKKGEEKVADVGRKKGATSNAADRPAAKADEKERDAAGQPRGNKGSERRRSPTPRPHGCPRHPPPPPRSLGTGEWVDSFERAREFCGLSRSVQQLDSEQQSRFEDPCRRAIDYFCSCWNPCSSSDNMEDWRSYLWEDTTADNSRCCPQQQEDPSLVGAAPDTDCLCGTDCTEGENVLRSCLRKPPGDESEDNDDDASPDPSLKYEMKKLQLTAPPHTVPSVDLYDEHDKPHTNPSCPGGEFSEQAADKCPDCQNRRSSADNGAKASSQSFQRRTQRVPSVKAIVVRPARRSSQQARVEQAASTNATYGSSGAERSELTSMNQDDFIQTDRSASSVTLDERATSPMSSGNGTLWTESLETHDCLQCMKEKDSRMPDGVWLQQRPAYAWSTPAAAESSGHQAGATPTRTPSARSLSRQQQASSAMSGQQVGAASNVQDKGHEPLLAFAVPIQSKASNVEAGDINMEGGPSDPFRSSFRSADLSIAQIMSSAGMPSTLITHLGNTPQASLLPAQNQSGTTYLAPPGASSPRKLSEIGRSATDPTLEGHRSKGPGSCVKLTIFGGQDGTSKPNVMVTNSAPVLKMPENASKVLSIPGFPVMPTGMDDPRDAIEQKNSRSKTPSRAPSPPASGNRALGIVSAPQSIVSIGRRVSNTVVVNGGSRKCPKHGRRTSGPQQAEGQRSLTVILKAPPSHKCPEHGKSLESAGLPSNSSPSRTTTSTEPGKPTVVIKFPSHHHSGPTLTEGPSHSVHNHGSSTSPARQECECASRGMEYMTEQQNMLSGMRNLNLEGPIDLDSTVDPAKMLQAVLSRDSGSGQASRAPSNNLAQSSTPTSNPQDQPESVCPITGMVAANQIKTCWEQTMKDLEQMKDPNLAVISSSEGTEGFTASLDPKTTCEVSEGKHGLDSTYSLAEKQPTSSDSETIRRDLNETLSKQDREIERAYATLSAECNKPRESLEKYLTSFNIGNATYEEPQPQQQQEQQQQEQQQQHQQQDSTLFQVPGSESTSSSFGTVGGSTTECVVMRRPRKNYGTDFTFEIDPQASGGSGMWQPVQAGQYGTRPQSASIPVLPQGSQGSGRFVQQQRATPRQQQELPRAHTEESFQDELRPVSRILDRIERWVPPSPPSIPDVPRMPDSRDPRFSTYEIGPHFKLTKAVAHDNITTPNVPLSGYAYAFPRLNPIVKAKYRSGDYEMAVEDRVVANKPAYGACAPTVKYKGERLPPNCVSIVPAKNVQPQQFPRQ